MVLAEPVGEYISLNLEQFRNHQHQCVNVDDKSHVRQIPAIGKKLYFSDHGETRDPLKAPCDFFSFKAVVEIYITSISTMEHLRNAMHNRTENTVAFA